MMTQRDYDDDDEDAELKDPVKIGNMAPDWGRSYGIKDLWSEIKPGLWVGGTHDNDTVMHGRDGWESLWSGLNITEDAEITTEEFQAVVTLYAWARPVDWLVEEYRWGIFDGGEGPDIEDVRDVVVWAHKRWKNDKKILLRCQAGLSRSTFITALVLVRDGMEIQDAIDLIRDKRSPSCLNVNGSSAKGAFTRILMDTPVEYWRD